VELSAIYGAYHERLVAYAAKLIGRDDAEDVAQEVFVKIGRSLHTLSDDAHLASWIYAITLNTVRDLVRARARAAEKESVVEMADPARRSPEEITARHEMVACYLDYVRRLPRAYYDVYALSELEELPVAEIAARLSVSAGAVKIRLHRARAMVHEALRRHCQCYVNDRGELMGEPKRDPGL
jgi:RNA polymerase sigma-70 factor (ECF subfamily)